MKLEEYINKLKTEEAAAYIELDKDKEVAYMEALKYHFVKVFDAIPDSPKPLKILDIGPTPFTLFIKENYPHYEVSTLDRTNLMEGRCKARDIQFKTCNLDEQPLPFEDNYFDLVIFTEVLEHIFNPPTEVLREVRRIMRGGGGKLILSVPNIATLYNRIKLLFGITPLGNPDELMKKTWVHGHGHIHEYTMKEIASLLEACNFTISSKKFLQPRVVDDFKKSNKSGTLPLIRGIYHAVGFLIPPFRATNYIECYKR